MWIKRFSRRLGSVQCPVNEKLSAKDSFIVVVVLYAGVDSLGRLS